MLQSVPLLPKPVFASLDVQLAQALKFGEGGVLLSSRDLQVVIIGVWNGGSKAVSAL
jgi:hypothetical protein